MIIISRSGNEMESMRSTTCHDDCNSINCWIKLHSNQLSALAVTSINRFFCVYRINGAKFTLVLSSTIWHLSSFNWCQNNLSWNQNRTKDAAQLATITTFIRTIKITFSLFWSQNSIPVKYSVNLKSNLITRLKAYYIQNLTN